MLAAALAAGGCQASLRGWESAALPTHDRQRAFEAVQEVLGRQFEIAEANWTRGTVETRPALFEGKPEGTLADLRGAGGRWRRAATCELGRDGLTIVARMVVRVQREATAAAVRAASSTADGRAAGSPMAITRTQATAARTEEDVWTDVGTDPAAARELLAQIAERVRHMEQEEALPEAQTPKQALEEGERVGAEQGR